MNPKPLVGLKNLTVPIAIYQASITKITARQSGAQANN
jgi:hypothetical protein